jgi:hypothetical protein
MPFCVAARKKICEPPLPRLCHLLIARQQCRDDFVSITQAFRAHVAAM